MKGGEVLKALQQKPIAYYRIYKDITSSTVAGVVLSQIMYWGTRYEKFWKTDSDIMRETGVAPGELRQAKIKIKALPFVVVTIEGVPATTCYAVDWDSAFEYIEDYMESLNKISEIDKTEEKDNKSSGNDDPQFSEIDKTCLVEDTKLYKETTQRLHVKSISKEIQSPSDPASPTESPLDYNGLLCPVCKEPQFTCRSGDTCSNGHGEESGIEKEKPKLKKLPIKKKTPNPFDHTPEALKILTHWKKRRGKTHTQLPAGQGVRKIKQMIDELLILGRNPYIKVCNDHDMNQRKWTVDDIIKAIDVYAYVKHKPVDKMYFSEFVVMNYNGFQTRKLRNHSPLVDSFEDIPNEEVVKWQELLRKKFKELYPAVEINATVLLNCSKFLIEQDKIYTFTPRANAFNPFNRIVHIFIAYMRRLVTESGTKEPLKYMSGQKNLDTFIKYSVTKSFYLLLKKRSKVA